MTSNESGKRCPVSRPRITVRRHDPKARSIRATSLPGRGAGPRGADKIDAHGRIHSSYLATDPSAYAMIDWSDCPAVEHDPARVSGAWVFRGTRIPIAALFENLEDGASISDFEQWFPGVSREQVRAVLEHVARSSLVAS